MSVQQRSAARARRERRSRPGTRSVLIAALTVMTAVAFGLIVYFSGTTVAWFATSPTSDPVFGELNACLLRRLPQARGGFAVSPDGARAAAFDGSGVAVCERGTEAHWIALPGVSAAAWDFKGSLWLATSKGALWHVGTDGAQQPAGEMTVVALAGHAKGVVALDASGKLASLSDDGQALGYAELPRPPPEDVQLSVDAAGQTVSVVAGGGVWLFSADALKPLRAESPCQVQFLWWLPQPSRALVACGPGESWALTFDAHSGAKDAAQQKERQRSTLLPVKTVYVQSCQDLPCEARAP